MKHTQLKKEISIKITNAKQFISVLEDISSRSLNGGNYYSSEGHKIMYQSILTLIKVLKEAK